VKIPKAVNSSVSQGNFLETLNISLNGEWHLSLDAWFILLIIFTWLFSSQYFRSITLTEAWTELVKCPS
jgi:hypothetical protein